MRSYLPQNLERIPCAVADGAAQQPCAGKGDLFLDLYDLANAPRCWQRFLTGICKPLNASCGVIAKHRFGRESDQVLAFYACPEQPAEANDDRPADADYRTTQQIVFPGILERLPAAPIVSTSIYGLHAPALFAQLGAKHLLVGQASHDRDAIVYVAVGRDCHQLPFSQADEELLASLIPHLQQAMQLASLIEKTSTSARLSAAMLDLIPLGVVILDERGACVAINDAARKSLDSEGVLLRQIAGQLPKRNGAARPQPLPGEPAMLTLRKSDFDQPLVAVVRRVGSDLVDRHHFVAFIIDAARSHDVQIAVKTLEGLYGLTTAEARVAALIAKNHSPAQIAETLGTTLHTVRTHLRHIFEKTTTERQIDLVHLLLRMSAALQVPQENGKDCRSPATAAVLQPSSS